MSTTTEALFTLLTVEAVPHASSPTLEKIQKSLGFVPRRTARFANNPTVPEGYRTLAALCEKGPFSPRERRIIPL